MQATSAVIKILDTHPVVFESTTHPSIHTLWEQNAIWAGAHWQRSVIKKIKQIVVCIIKMYLIKLFFIERFKNNNYYYLKKKKKERSTYSFINARLENSTSDHWPG